MDLSLVASLGSVQRAGAPAAKEVRRIRVASFILRKRIDDTLLTPFPAEQFVDRVLDGIEGGDASTSLLLSPVSFHEFSLPAEAGVKVDALAAVTRVILSDAIVAATPEPVFRAKLARAGVPEEGIVALSSCLFVRLAGGALHRRRAARLPAILGGRVLHSFDWSVQQTLSSSNLDRPVAPSVILSLRTVGGTSGSSSADVGVREDFVELSADELDAVIAQLHEAVAAGNAVMGASVSQQQQ